MPKFAVGYINFYDNELTIEIVEASNWMQALTMHSKLKIDTETEYWAENTPYNLEDCKEYFFDGDAMIDVVEIK